MTLNGEMTFILHYFTEFGSFRGACIKVVDKTITMDNLRLLRLVVNVCITKHLDLQGLHFCLALRPKFWHRPRITLVWAKPRPRLCSLPRC